MSNPLGKIFSSPVDTAAAVGKPVLAGGAELAGYAHKQLSALVGGVGGEGRYAAFISYSHADMKVARWLHRAIENYCVPSALNLPAHRSHERERWARPAGDNQRFLNEMLNMLRVGCPWRDMHVRNGKWNSVYVRFRRWAEQGV